MKTKFLKNTISADFKNISEDIYEKLEKTKTEVENFSISLTDRGIFTVIFNESFPNEIFEKGELDVVWNLEAVSSLLIKRIILFISIDKYSFNFLLNPENKMDFSLINSLSSNESIALGRNPQNPRIIQIGNLNESHRKVLDNFLAFVEIQKINPIHE